MEILQEEVKKPSNIPKKKSASEKMEQELKVVAIILRFKEAKVDYNSTIGAF
jgi:hypothetical protein